jgi:hypothetical protein
VISDLLFLYLKGTISPGAATGRMAERIQPTAGRKNDPEGVSEACLQPEAATSGEIDLSLEAPGRLGLRHVTF